ncbi:MAG: rRNA maturation RNase YbeY [Methylobacter sp.]|nr:MAG: rRNA maturation RNase YbeY [Methylobacter sp.]
MNVIDLQVLTDLPGQPLPGQLQTWVDSVLHECKQPANLVIRIVDESEGALLNAQYRGKNGPTNILSFPFEQPEGIDFAAENADLSHYLGDLVICSPVIAQEAESQGKALTDHWAHIVIHGVLHLLGFDHLKAQDADIMEAKEIAILKKLNINNPYCEENS